MKKLLFSTLVLLALGAGAQEADSIKPAAKGVVYGEALQASGSVLNVNDLQLKTAKDVFDGKITGKVKEVCKEAGCWIRLEKADGSTLMVRSKDHAFFMPQDLIGHTVVMEGTAGVKELSEEARKHMAKDAGKPKEEIEKIKGSKKSVEFTAKGIEVVD